MKFGFFIKIILQLFTTIFILCSIFYAVNYKEEDIKIIEKSEKNTFCDYFLKNEIYLNNFEAVANEIEKLDKKICLKENYNNNETIENFLKRITNKYEMILFDTCAAINPLTFDYKNGRNFIKLKATEYAKKEAFHLLFEAIKLYETLPSEIINMKTNEYLFKLHILEMMKICGNLFIFDKVKSDHKLNNNVYGCISHFHQEKNKKCRHQDIFEKEIIEKIADSLKTSLCDVKKQYFSILSVNNHPELEIVKINTKIEFPDEIIFLNNVISFSCSMKNYYNNLKDFCNEKKLFEKDIYHDKNTEVPSVHKDYFIKFQENIHRINRNIYFQKLRE